MPCQYESPESWGAASLRHGMILLCFDCCQGAGPPEDCWDAQELRFYNSGFSDFNFETSHRCGD